MNLSTQSLRRFCAALLLIVCGAGPGIAAAQTNTHSVQIRVVEIQGAVEVLPEGQAPWKAAVTNQLLKPSDHVRTGPNSRMALRWSDQSVIPFGASTELEILPIQGSDSEAGLHLIRGILSFFHRDQPGRIRVITRGATAGIEGTEFVLAVNDADRTTVSIVDGKVRFANEQGTLILTNGQQAIADVGQAPQQTAGFIANNVLQWCFYYPAVLDPAELQFSADEQSALADSLNAYRSGDLLQALAKYPAGRQPASDAERIYHAALWLSVGQVEQTEAELSALSANSQQPTANALGTLIAAVKRAEAPSAINYQLSTSLLAASYYEQSRSSRGSLEQALGLARRATTNSPQFGFAWERLAELEFSFGHTRQAMDALEKSLTLSPRNAQGLALKGFLLASENKTSEAIQWFDRAIAVDAALGNAWLGRGLSRIKRGDVKGGREDLLIAAALEPQRSDLRSYLGKAHETAGDYPRAEKELVLAKQLDPNDPTPYLYSALVNHENNRVNDAIRDLEKSEQLNDNRSVYRSQLLLNQDDAVRSANLATIYSDAGLKDVGIREASRAVTYDYANYSAHFFLANSYNELRDPHGFGWNMRYETPTGSEWLLANLLAPVDAGPLSSLVSQSEYSRMFERNRLGFASDTVYLSRGAWDENFAQFGTYDTFNYSINGIYRTDPGQAINNDSELKQIGLTLKQQIAPQDTVSFNVELGEAKTGDPAQHYNGAATDHTLRTDEKHEPTLRLGYHHEWSPGVHTLLLLGRDVLRGSDTTSNYTPLVSFVQAPDQIVNLRYDPGTLKWAPQQELYSAELQQIFEQENHSTVIGGLYQHTDFQIQDLEYAVGPSYFAPSPNPIYSTNIVTEFERFSVYGYHSWQILDPLLLVGGISYDRLILPLNWNGPPVSDHSQTKDQVSPKAGLVWTPAHDFTVRAAYTRSLTGMSFDQSTRIEPTQVAGLNQSYRNVIPDSIAGATSGARLETFGLSLEQKFETSTYFGISGELLYSDVNRLRGSYFFDVDNPDVAVYNPDFILHERLHSRERSIIVTADQLLDKEWAVGVRYRLTEAKLNDDLPGVDIPLVDDPNEPNPDIVPHQRLESLLHQLNLHANFNHASGFFSTLEAVWYLQHNSGFLRKDDGNNNSPYRERDRGDEFWQFNLIGGYRFYHRRAIVSAGVLNLTDQNYHLSPLTYYNEMPRERTFMARFQLNF